MFVGMVCLLIDDRTDGVEFLLPDAAGYALMAVGFHLLAGVDRRFRIGRAVAAVMVLVALVTLVDTSEYVGEYGDLPYYWNRLWPLPIAEVLGDAAVVWLAIGGLREQAIRRGKFRIAEPALNARSVYVAIGLFRAVFQGVYVLGVATGFLFITRLESFVAIPLLCFQILGALLVLEVLATSWRRRREFLNGER